MGNMWQSICDEVKKKDEEHWEGGEKKTPWGTLLGTCEGTKS